MVKDLILSSFDQPVVKMSDEVREATEILRRFLFNRVYLSEEQKVERDKAKRLVKELYFFFCRIQISWERSINFTRRSI